MRFRGKSIRRKIVALLLVPLVSLTALWGFATFLTGREAGDLMGASTIVEKVGHPLEDTVRVIQNERRQTLVFLADPRASDALPCCAANGPPPTASWRTSRRAPGRRTSATR